MTIKKVSTAQLLSAVYVLLCIIAFAYQIMRPAQDKFSGIFVVLLTLPWSIVAALIGAFVIYKLFNYEITQIGWNVIMMLCVMINAYTIYRITNNKK